MPRGRRRKCLHCKTFFRCDARNASRQRYCTQAACRKASHQASNRRWRAGTGQDYFKRPEHKKRVKAWREQNPGYWRSARRVEKSALQDSLISQPSAGKHVTRKVPLQDLLKSQQLVLLGLTATLVGNQSHALQDDIATVYRNLIHLGQRLSSQGGLAHELFQTTAVSATAADTAAAIQLDRPTSGP